MIMVTIFEQKESLLALSTSSSYTHNIINHPVQKRYYISRGLEDTIINKIKQLNLFLKSLKEGIDSS